MSIVCGEVRSNARQARASRRAGVVKPSIREVCLVGNEHAGGGSTERDWASGGRVTWLGRAYRVEATQGAAIGSDGTPRYVHLAAWAEG